MPGKNIKPKEVIDLLSKLKKETPDYPSDLLAARKSAFINQAITIKFEGPKQGGKGGGDGGGSATGGSGGTGALGGMTTAQGVLLQAVVGVWIIAAMLTSAYIFREQIIDLLQDNGIVVEMTQAPLAAPLGPAPVATETELAPTEVSPTETPEATPVPESVGPDGSVNGEVPSDGSSNIENVPDTPDSTKGNNGLHLGQTPGAPDTPNQDNPDNPNKPDKPK